jgi:acyl carrier protein
MNKLENILKDLKPDIDFKNENNLIEDGILSSFDIVTLVAMLNEEYKINITVKELIPENFSSMESILKMVKSLEG